MNFMFDPVVIFREKLWNDREHSKGDKNFNKSLLFSPRAFVEHPLHQQDAIPSRKLLCILHDPFFFTREQNRLVMLDVHFLFGTLVLSFGLALLLFEFLHESDLLVFHSNELIDVG